MNRLIITCENAEQAGKIIALLEEAEQEGTLNFPFNVEMTIGILPADVSNE